MTCVKVDFLPCFLSISPITYSRRNPKREIKIMWNDNFIPNQRVEEKATGAFMWGKVSSHDTIFRINFSWRIFSVPAAFQQRTLKFVLKSKTKTSARKNKTLCMWKISSREFFCLREFCWCWALHCIGAWNFVPTRMKSIFENCQCWQKRTKSFSVTELKNGTWLF